MTCPINKEGIQAAGYNYLGHTEILADLTQTQDYRMSLFAGDIRVVHISSHCSLLQAIAYVKRDRIAESIRIAHAALVQLGLERRRIGVAGLNPHAGEDGRLGREEIDEIRPAVEKAAAAGIPVAGPYPPDIVFLAEVAMRVDLSELIAARQATRVLEASDRIGKPGTGVALLRLTMERLLRGQPKAK